MSHYLSQLEGSERAQECIRNDKEMESNLPDVFKLALLPFAPPQFSESELIAADVAYLEGQARRDAERVRVAHEADLQELRAKGLL